jgi:hypothetical protein
LIFATIAAVGEKGVDGLVPRIGGNGAVASRDLDVGEDGPKLPWLNLMPGRLGALDHPFDTYPGLIKPLELEKGQC